MSVVFELKLLIFFSSVASEDFDVICLTETWLCEQINSSDLFEDRYLVFRKERDSSTSSCKRGGGVIIAIKKNISASQIHVPLIDLECIWISVKLILGKKLLLCVLYLPPASGIDRYNKFFDCFDRFGSFENMFICGDFNLSINNNFNDSYCLYPTLRELLNFMHLFNMKQINKILNCNDKYLDFILSNINSCDIAIRHSDRPLVTEDFHHPELSIFMQFVPARTNKSTDHVLKNDFKRADFPLLWYSIREIDWNFLLTFSDVDDAVYNFYNCIDDVFARTVPLKRAITKKSPFW
ncbi:hypothetical protein AVEN_183811-1 [Araneus ventricosus]|uniref:Endonuclease/exonuclease/phosphatase domain-containing protein n=1 Tax=Araneus ventricosus TaxID=182803 RepID=A0A4Y2ID02_ARAVE|nr:hypothetical protein AVEN_183811-1 [Araneus ventricosus]